MSIDFWRYSATGNTFLIFDGRDKSVKEKLSEKKIQELCDRYKTDGVIFLETSNQYDFHMCYLNRDGGEVEMCGNGARSITHFAYEILKLPCERNYTFSTFNSVYTSRPEDNWPVKMTELSDEGAIDIDDLFSAKNSFYVNTGVPHCCFEVEDPKLVDLLTIGKEIRYNERFPKGTNVNFFSHDKNNIVMRTYERGVEGETLSCGTGAAAVVITLLRKKNLSGIFNLDVPGGKLMIECSKDGFNLWLAGPVEITESGSID